MGIPRTGSLGIGTDLWHLTHAACYADPVRGHGWTPPSDVAEKIRVTDEAWDAGFMRDPELCDDSHATVPFSPKCTDCRRAARRVLVLRGLTSPRIEKLFRDVGAKWDWTTEAKAQARRDSDHGTAVIDPSGPGMVLDSTLRARAHRAENRIAYSDRKAASATRAKVASL